MKNLVIKTIRIIVLSFFYIHSSLNAGKGLITLPSSRGESSHTSNKLGTAYNFKQLSKNLPPINWNHVFNYSYSTKNNTLTGLHSAAYYPKANLKIIRKNPLGVCLAQFSHTTKKGDVLTKVSTFFPLNWNAEKVEEKVKEALSNPCRRELPGNSIVSCTKEGMKIQFCIKGNTIVSLFPLLDREPLESLRYLFEDNASIEEPLEDNKFVEQEALD